MGFFADLGNMAYKPVKAGSDALSRFMQPSLGYEEGALTTAIKDSDREKIMPSITELGLRQFQPGNNTVLQQQPNTQQLGEAAVSGAPVYTDSSRKTAVMPEKEEDTSFDLQALGKALQGISGGKQSAVSSATSGRVGGSFRFDENLYKNPLIERELQQLYMAPLYQKLGGK